VRILAPLFRKSIFFCCNAAKKDFWQEFGGGTCCKTQEIFAARAEKIAGTAKAGLLKCLAAS
jgi:hypothetical protein